MGWADVFKVAGDLVGGPVAKIADVAVPVIAAASQQHKANEQLKYAQNLGRSEQQISNDTLALAAKRELASEQQANANTEIAQEAAREKAQTDAYEKALRAAYAKNVQDVHVDRSGFKGDVPTIAFSGGARPSAIGPEGRLAASTLSTQAQQQLEHPVPFTPPATPTLYQQTTPTLPLPPGGSLWDSLAGASAFGLSAIDALHHGLYPSDQQPTAGATSTPSTGSDVTGATGAPGDVPQTAYDPAVAFSSPTLAPSPLLRGVTMVPRSPLAPVLPAPGFGGVTFGGG